LAHDAENEEDLTPIPRIADKAGRAAGPSDAPVPTASRRLRLVVDCSGQKVQNEGGRTYIEYFLTRWTALYGAELTPIFSNGELPPRLGDAIAISELPHASGPAPARRLRDLHLALPRVIRSLQPDAAFFPGNVLAARLPKSLPTVVAIRSTLHYHFPAQSSPWRNAYLRAATLHAVRSASRVIVPSSATADDLMRHARARRAKLVVIPHGVDVALFQPGAARDVERTTFLFVSRPSDYKGLLTVYRAVRYARSLLGSDGLRLLVVDGGVTDSQRAALLAAAKDLDIAADVSLLGRVNHDDLSRLYRRASALVLPTNCESFGHPFLEAAASGCPVITGRGSGIDTTIGPVARQVSPHDHREIADAMVAISRLSDQERGSTGGELRRWAERFSWDTTVAETREVISELVH
jgi:glycosyltransferase involved in cell wall biosynthesis